MRAPLCVTALVLACLATRAVDACEEVSDVVGYHRCSSFGAGWDDDYAAETPPTFGLRRNPFGRRAYPRGSLTRQPDDASSGARHLGCLDLRVELVREPRSPRSSAVLAFTFGNTCDLPARVDLGKVAVATSSETLSLYDPASEVHPATLDGRDQAREVLRFDSPSGALVDRVCVGLTDVTPRPDPATGLMPVCLTTADTAVDEHEVIGRNWLYPFGNAWDLAGLYAFVEVGVYAETVDMGQSSFGGTAANGQDYSFGGSALGRSVSYGIDAHLSARLAGPLYVGFLVRGGGGQIGARPPVRAGSASVAPGQGFGDVSFGGLLGVMSSRFAGVRARAELAGGIRALDVDVDAASCRPDSPCVATALDALVEPRVALDAWLNPWWSTSAWVAADALQRSGVVGLSLVFHVRAFDGVP